MKPLSNDINIPSRDGGIQIAPQVHPAAPYDQETEISLVDLWLVVAKRRKVFFAVVAAVSLIGIAIALFMPRQYIYTTVIEIGSQLNNGQLQKIAAPESVLSRLKEYYISAALRDYSQKIPDRDVIYKVEARVPKNGDIVLLESKSTTKDENVYRELHTAIVNKLAADHKKMMDSIHDVLTANLSREQIRLQELLSQEITPFNTQMSGMKLQPERNPRSGSSSQLVPEIQIQLKNQIKNDHEREVALERLQIANLETQIAGLQPTRAIDPGVRSLEPTGASRKTIVALSLALGMMVGLFAVFFAEFLAKAREKSTETDSSLV